MGFLHLYQQVCAPVGQGGEVLLESRFLVVGVGQMLEWGWVVCGIGCLWRAFQVRCCRRIVSPFFFLGGGEANISGSAGFSSVSGGLSSSGEVGVSNIRLDSVSKQMPASKYGWRGLARSSVSYSRVTEGEGSGGVFKFSSTVSNSGSTVGDSG